MPATINVARLNTFKHLLNNGGLYAISGFDVTRSNHHFKLCDSPVSIRFTEKTSFVQVPETHTSIPKEMFRYRDYDQLVALANTNSELPGQSIRIVLLNFKEAVNIIVSYTSAPLSYTPLSFGSK